MTFPGHTPKAAAGSDRDTSPWRSPAGAALTWIALVAIAVAGRAWQPTWHGEPLWHATPLAGVALAAGFVFPNAVVAASVPLVALAIGNLALPGYGSLAIAAVVYAATAWPVLLGTAGILGRSRPRWMAVIGGSLATSLVFFLSTNLAHWAFRSDYPHTASGLAACFAAALPFHRWMPVGDVAWTLAVFGLLAAVQAVADATAGRRLHPQPVSTRTLD
jgi:hypothetical protein